MIISYGVLNIKPKYARIAITLFIILSIAPIIAYNSSTKKMQFRESATYLKDKIGKDDVIFFNINTGITPFTYYYGESAQTYALPNISRAIELANGRGVNFAQ